LGIYVKDERGNVQLPTVPVGEISEGIQAALREERSLDYHHLE
jgi:hypothetical protein